MKNTVLLMMILTLFSCQTAPEQKADTKDTYTPETMIEKSVEAHGGLANWKSYPQLSFDLVTGSDDNIRRESIITDLYSRYEKITGGDYQMGYDGENYWQKIGEGVKEKNVKFMINLQFYFFAMPFVLTDPGVNEESLGRKTVAGKEYEVVKATFDAGTGVAPEDQYILYLDPTTLQLEIMLYSVTYFNSENATKYGALKYSEWQEVNGLNVPKVIERYYWDAENEDLGEMRGDKRFENISFSKEKADMANFAVPEGGAVAQ